MELIAAAASETLLQRDSRKWLSLFYMRSCSDNLDAPAFTRLINPSTHLQT